MSLAYQELVTDGLVASNPRSGLRVNEEMQEALRASFSRMAEDAVATGPEWRRLLPPVHDPFLDIIKPDDWVRYPYPFLYGQPCIEGFPHAGWMRALRRSLEHPHETFSLRDAASADDPWLVELLCNHILPARGIDVRPDHVLLTLGAQHALHLVVSAVVPAGADVGLETPGYADAAHIVARAGATVVPFEVDAGGLIVEDRVRAMRAMYVTPSHQSPTGATMHSARRRQLIEQANRGGTFIIEDDYDSEFRHEGRPMPALKADDHAGYVIYIGSFSKFLAPGIRLGFVVADPEFIDYLRRMRRYMVRHPPGQIQRALAILIDSGDYQRAVQKTRRVLRRRWMTLSSALARHMPWPVSVPTGGTSVWVEGPDSLDSRALLESARRAGVLIEQGEMFSLSNASLRHCFRLGFTAIPESRIEAGVRILASLL